MHEAHAANPRIVPRLGGSLGGRQLADPGLLGTLGLALLLAMAVLFVQRRAAGALAVPLDPATLLAVALAAGGMALAIRVGAKAHGPQHRAGRALYYFGPGIALAAMALALTVPETTPEGLAALWGGIACTELVAAVVLLAPWRGSIRRTAQPAVTGLLRDEPAPAPPRSASESIHMTRSTSPDGSEQWSGWIRAELTAGQRNTQEHVAFCPPLTHLPEIHVHQSAGPRATITLGQILTYGARFDIRLDAPSGERAVVEMTFRTVAPALTALECGGHAEEKR